MSDYLLSTPTLFGTAGSRPARAAPGQAYVATDTGAVSYYDAANQTWYTPSNASGGGPPVLVRSTSVAGTDGTTPAIDTTGCDLLVQVGVQNAPTDNQNNAWVLAAPNPATGSGAATLWYVRNPVTSTAHTFTSNQNSIAVGAYANANGAKNISYQGNYAPANVQGTTIIANELVIVGWWSDNGGTGPTAVSYAGFTQDQFIAGSASNASVGLYHQVVAAAGTVINENPTITGSVYVTGGSAICSFLP